MLVAGILLVATCKNNMTTVTTPLLASDNDSALEHQQTIIESWKWYHTMTVLIIRVMVDFVFKNPLVFFLDYEQGFGVSYIQFATIIVSADVGCICAVFVGEKNKQYLKSEEQIMEIYLFICGIASILTPVLSFFNINTVYVVIWSCCMRFIVGLSFAFISASSIQFASEYASNPNQITSIIAVLHYSWPLSTILNIGAGYLIEVSWMYVFVLSGIALICASLFAKLVFHCNGLIEPRAVQSTSETDDIQNGLHILFTDYNSLLIIFASFFMSLRAKSIYITTSSLWMETTYGLTPSMVGWTTLTVVIGEIFALFIMSGFSYKCELWISAVGSLSHQLFGGGLLFILAVVYGNHIPFVVALIMTGLLTMGHELFYVVQQSNAIQYAPLPRLKLLLLLSERMAQECAAFIAIMATEPIWDSLGDNSILVLSIIWIGCTSLQSLVLLIYRSEPTMKQSPMHV
eukprot:253454_1